MIRLGITARRGPRTGVIQLQARVRPAAAKIVDGFRPCGTSDLMPGPGGRVTAVRVAMADTGAARDVPITVRPDDRLNMAVWAVYNGQRREIRLHPRTGLCMSRAEWERAIRTILVHELTHAADPGVDRRVEAAVAGRSRRKATPGGCDYINDPVEVSAFLAEVRAEVLVALGDPRYARLMKAGGMVRTKADLLKFSDTYRDIKSCLTGANRRRFLQMVARLA